ncbi:hypothetical protein [Alkaliphilus hydrothermalis]|uniref:Membrane protein n=1 Tax=Alkaliphilus hydrothermalis TaxID=1482730 RepID=A0ABS2NRH2_9FIRM|nr:hypothetical protein [Alkaliphilus hydrothermalis]MBM7615521.1 putative membrane protein [Alkaliphilus hydrothermalis]
MDVFFGVIMTIIGVLFLVFSVTKSENKLYQIFVKRSEILWKKKVYIFHSIVGIILIALGILYTFGIIWVE